MKICREYDVVNFIIEIDWDYDGDVNMTLEATTDTNVGLHKLDDERWSYIASTREEAISKEPILIEKYYEYMNDIINKAKKEFENNVSILEESFKKQLKEEATTYKDTISEMKKDLEEEISILKGDLDEEISEFTRCFDEPVIKNIIRTKKLKRV